MRLYIFNPDADLALGNNEENYMAPAPIRRMAEDLALLPVWYARPGSEVLAPSAYNDDYLKQMRQLFPLDVQLIAESRLPGCTDARVTPWAWNRAVRKRLAKGGIPERMLPAPEAIDEYRRIASRAYSSGLQHLFADHGPDYVCGCSRLVEGDGKKPVTSEVMAGFKDGAVFKSPWSGSGRGLFWCRHGFRKEASARCGRLLREYGCFTVEPIYNKVEDFALEYYSDGGGKLGFVGYSRFMTNGRGAYAGNVLTSDRKVEEWLRQYVPTEAFMRIRRTVETGLHALYAHRYAGYLGVDMMVCRQEGKHPYAVHPHVEVNLRMNMGVVSHFLYKNLMLPGGEGRFSVDHFPSNEALRARHEHCSSRYPLVVKDGKILSGYLSLAPVTPHGRSQACLWVGSGNPAGREL